MLPVLCVTQNFSFVPLPRTRSLRRHWLIVRNRWSGSGSRMWIWGTHAVDGCTRPTKERRESIFQWGPRAKHR